MRTSLVYSISHQKITYQILREPMDQIAILSMYIVFCIKKNTPCSYFIFFFHIPRSVFFNAKEVSCRAENHKSFFVGFVCRVDFIMFRKHPNRKFPVDFEQEKDARFETRERCNRICLDLQIYIHVQCISERQAFPILLTFISLNQLFSDFQIVDGF